LDSIHRKAGEISGNVTAADNSYFPRVRNVLYHKPAGYRDEDENECLNRKNFKNPSESYYFEDAALERSTHDHAGGLKKDYSADDKPGSQADNKRV
jgi:hypothetical protein